MAMGVDVRMNYSQMEEAANNYGQVASQLHDLHEKMKQLGQRMEDGALLGDAGADFKDAINSVLLAKMMLIEAKMWELQKDLNGAVAKTRDGVDTAESRFK